MSVHVKLIKQFVRIFCLTLIVFNSLKAQNIDSLIHLLKTDKADTDQVILLNDIAWELFKTGSYDTSMLYAEKAKKMAESINYKKGIANAYNKIGNDYQRKGNYPEALKNHFSSLKLMKELNERKSIASCYNNIGIVYRSQSNYPEALKNYYASLKMYEELDNKEGIATLYTGIGVIYKLQSNYQEALKNFSTALKMQKLLNDKRGMIVTYGNMGNVYSNMGNKDESLLNYSLSLKISMETGDKRSISASYNSIANIYADRGNYQEALKNYLMSAKLANEIHNEPALSIAYGNIGEVYKDLKNYSEAKKYLVKALALSSRIGDKSLIKDHYQYLAMIDSALGNYKTAFEFQKMYSAYKDSIYNEDNSQQINELSAKYETEKKEKEIALLNVELLTGQKDKEALGLQIARKNSIIYVTLLGALFLILILVLFFSRQRLKQKNKHQEEINIQQKNNAVGIIQEQEKERNRIAKDLHDSVGTFLSTLKINLQLLENFISVEKKPSYNNVLDLADKTSVELRNITKNISSETLIEAGLPEALEELTEGVNRLDAVHLEFKTHGITTRLEEIIEVNLYRVAQELVNNCVKHSKADKATLQLIAHEDNILLMMEDNGKGFDVQSTKNGKGGMGFKNIFDRVDFIKGTVKFESKPGKGTTVIIETPKHLY